MASVLLQVADALVTTLNGLTWSGTDYTARRVFADVLDEELIDAADDAIRVDVVVPEDYDDVALDTRGTVTRRATFDVVIRRKFAAEDNDAETGQVDGEQIAELIELGELLSTGTIFDRMASYTSAAWIESQHAPIYRRDHLRQLRQFTGAVAITFEITSDL